MTDAVEAFLNRLQHPALAGIDLSLDRMFRLLGALGQPHKRLPPVIHVAGTNGKGSLLAYLKAIFESAGYRVHRYTSPHLVEFRERIVLAGKEIDNATLENIVRHVAPVLQSHPATFFEAATAVAFLAFAEKKADVLLLETGLGGRLDATNVIDKPLLTAITPVSFDHMEYLGDTLEKIAAEKAGIIKRGIPCIVGRQEAVAAEIIAQAAKTLAAPLYCLGMEWQVIRQGEETLYQSPQRTLPLHPSLAGQFQYDNAATAIACIERLPSFTITDEHIRQGLAAAVWPARLERITHGRYNNILPPGIELWLDGGHNPQGGEVLAKWLKSRGLSAYLICGMGKGKDTAAYLKPLASYVTFLYGVAIPDEPQSKTAQQMENEAKAVGIEAHAAASVEKALQSISQHATTPAIACICGSLYLAGKVLAANGE